MTQHLKFASRRLIHVTRSFRRAAAAAMLVSALCGQSAPAPEFEVASVKVHADPPRIMGVKTTGARLIADAETVRGLIMWAYNLKNYQVEGPGPQSPVGDTFYDVVAKAGGDAEPTRDQFRAMLQSLLAQRFQLKLRRELREMPVYALVIGRNGPKLKPSGPDAEPGGRIQVVDRNYEITLQKATMSDVVDVIANSFLDRPVVDRTGLTGTYNVALRYTPETRANRASAPDPADINIFSAVQEQLGLRLEPRKADVEIFVVEHVAKPSEN